MVKGFGKALRLADAPQITSETVMKKNTPEKPVDRPATADIIAIRKTCDAEGTGLSHYVLMDKQVKQ